MQGTLQEFGLAEILQLVAMQLKTGLLRVESYDKVLTFYFRNGILVSCRDRRRVGGDPLLEYMKKTGYLDAWRTLHLSLELEEKRRDVADVLLEQNLITEAELQEALVDMTLDLVFRTYNWKEGTYRFLSGDEALRGLQHAMSLKMEGVLLEAARRVDEWPGLLSKLPSPQVLLAPVSGLPENLDQRSHKLLSRLHSPMRLVELMACARMPEYEVYEVVAAAIDAGFTRVLETPAVQEDLPLPETESAQPAADAAAPSSKAGATAAGRKQGGARRGGGSKGLQKVGIPRAWRHQSRHVLVFWCLVTLIVGVATWSIATGRARSERAQEPFTIREAREQLVREIEVYRALRGRYPETLQELAAANLAGPGLIERAAVSAYSVGPRGRSYRLEDHADPESIPGNGSSYR